jgi:transposase-like protein
MTVVALPISQVKHWTDIWPRYAADEERIALFADLLKSGDSLPPIEVVSNDDGTYLIADGVHRAFASRWAKRETIDVVIIQPTSGESPGECAYRRALETATQSALPLTKAERHRAVLRLHDQYPDLSNRSLAQKVGVSHDSVGRWIRQHAEQQAAPTGSADAYHRVTADDVARRLVLTLVRLDESRGLLDHVNGARMGRHLARAFVDRLGVDALGQAERFALWTADAVNQLKVAPQS